MADTDGLETPAAQYDLNALPGGESGFEDRNGGG